MREHIGTHFGPKSNMGQVLTMVVGAEEERVKVSLIVSSDEHRKASGRKIPDQIGQYEVVVNTAVLDTLPTRYEKWVYVKKVLSKYPLFQMDRLADNHRNFVKVEVKDFFKPPVLNPERINETTDEIVSGDYLADIIVHDYKNLATWYCLEPIW